MQPMRASRTAAKRGRHQGAEAGCRVGDTELCTRELGPQDSWGGEETCYPQGAFVHHMIKEALLPWADMVSARARSEQG